METTTRMLRLFLLLSTVYGFALCGDFCTDGLDTTYCTNGCCGWDDSYCCSDSWGTGSIAGTVVGIILFFIFIALIVACCRRRRYMPPTYVQTTQPSAGIAVVTTQQTNMATGYAPPVQQPYQKPYQPYPGQYPPQYPGQPCAQPPAYAP